MIDGGNYPDDWHARRVAVCVRDGYSCQRCGDQPPKPELHVDHEVPVSEGGGHELENLRALCADCHAERHDNNLCAACSLFGHYRMDEVKKHSSVGKAHLCKGHYKLIAERAPDRASVAGHPYDEVVGDCAMCLEPVRGRYLLAEYGQDGACAYLCGECRVLVVRNTRNARRELGRKIEASRGREGITGE